MEEEIVVEVSFSALEMIEEIYTYKSEFSKTSADKYIDGILYLIERLKEHPESCPPCKNTKLQKAGYRCCLYKDHIIVYEISGNTVKVLAVIHCKRNPDDISI